MHPPSSRQINTLKEFAICIRLVSVPEWECFVLISAWKQIQIGQNKNKFFHEEVF